VALHPVVDHGAGRAGVEGGDGVVLDDGDVADAAQVQHRQRPRQVLGQSGVVQRREGRALAAGGDIGGAEIVDAGDAQRRRQPGAVAQLPGEAPLRPVQHGLAVHADHVDGFGRQPGLVQQPAHGGDVQVGDGGGQVGQRLVLGPGRVARHRQQRVADIIGVGCGRGRAAGKNSLAVGLDHRHIDPVHRGAAHQADRGASGSGHAWSPRLIRQGR